MSFCTPTHFRIMKYSAHGFIPIVQEPLFEANAIIQTVIRVLGVYKSQLTGIGRKQRITEARYIALKIIRDNCPKYTLAQIGKLVNKDHSTVIYGLKQFNDWYDTDTFFRTKYNLVLARLKGGANEAA